MHVIDNRLLALLFSIINADILGCSVALGSTVVGVMTCCSHLVAFRYKGSSIVGFYGGCLVYNTYVIIII